MNGTTLKFTNKDLKPFHEVRNICETERENGSGQGV